MKGTCQHCRNFRTYHIKGKRLCWSCSHIYGVPQLYHTDAEHSLRGGKRSPIATCNLKPASFPTTAPPGSEEKLRVMAERAERGEQIFHEFDLTCR